MRPERQTRASVPRIQFSCILGPASRTQSHTLGNLISKDFMVFIAGLLGWLSMNQFLGSDPKTTLIQLRYLGTCLTGNAQEWYIRNIESWDHTTRSWTLESALEGMQKYFLHALTHRQASISYETTRQGGGTVQDLLNRLTKFTARMVELPGPYTQRKWFLAALREPLRREVLSRGHTAEFSHMEDLVSTAQTVEDTVHYDMGTWQLRDRVATMPPLRGPYRWGYGQPQCLGHNRHCMCSQGPR